MPRFMLSRPGIGVALALALLVAGVPLCPCAPDANEAGHSCCAPSLAISAGDGECCPRVPDLTGAPADGPAPARLADLGPAPEEAPYGSERPSLGDVAPAASPPGVLRI
jgi:hypothetical protein